jgi:hypothetical protein
MPQELLDRAAQIPHAGVSWTSWRDGSAVRGASPTALGDRGGRRRARTSSSSQVRSAPPREVARGSCASVRTGDARRLTAAHSIIAKALQEQRQILVLTNAELGEIQNTDQLIALFKKKMCELAVRGRLGC